MAHEITLEKILTHRKMRRVSGMVGCKDGSDAPLNSLSGISWRPADPMNPSCFCVDCRELWDPEATIDLELIKAGNQKALWVYSSLLPSVEEGWLSNLERGAKEEASSPPLDPTNHSLRITIPRTVPALSISLPAPRHRDIMNESKNDRIKKDLLELIMEYRGELIDVMDSRRRSISYPDPIEQEEFIKEVNKNEANLWEMIRAAELLINHLDA